MRTLLASALVAGLLIATGCNKPKPADTGTPGTGPAAPASHAGGGDTKPTQDTKPVPPPPEKGKISLEPIDKVTVAKEKTADVKIKVKRDKVDGDIKVTFTPEEDSGLTIEGVTIPKDADEVTAKVAANDKAKSGKVKVKAEAGEATAEKTFEVVVE